jgi:predicted nucleic acid-binding protein
VRRAQAGEEVTVTVAGRPSARPVPVAPHPWRVWDEVAELHFGVLVAAEPATRAERLRHLSVVQRRFQALPVDDTVAASYGRLAAAVVAAGRRPRPRVLDLLIAATAHAHGARLYTRRPADLVGADELVDVVAV